MSAAATKRVALIGGGMVAETHLRAIADLAEVEFEGAHLRDPAKAARFLARAEELGCGAGRSYETIEAIANDPDVDFALVLTPPNARMEAARILSAAKMPSLVEKPIERSAAAARQIVDLHSGVPFGVVFQHRAREASIRLASLLREGALGPIGLVQANVPWWREQSYYDEPGRGTLERDGGGVLISQAIHTLDLMLHLAGPVVEVSALAATTRFHAMESEDFVAAGLAFENGAVGSLIATTASYPGDAESIVVHGERGVATLRAGALAIDWRDGGREVTGAGGGSGGGGADPMAFTHDWHKSVIAQFARALHTGEAPMASGENALAAHRLIDALLLSAREKRAARVGEIA